MLFAVARSSQYNQANNCNEAIKQHHLNHSYIANYSGATAHSSVDKSNALNFHGSFNQLSSINKKYALTLWAWNASWRLSWETNNYWGISFLFAGATRHL